MIIKREKERDNKRDITIHI